jgi:hypothetical protein
MDCLLNFAYALSRRNTDNPQDARSPKDGAPELYPGQVARGGCRIESTPTRWASECP